MEEFDVNNLYKTFKFKIKIDEKVVGAFTKVSGLGVSVDRVQFRYGDDNMTTTTGVTTFTNYDNITLSRGVVDDLDFMDWMFSVASTDSSPPTRINAQRSLEIILIKDDGSDGTRWSISKAAPVSYRINELDSLNGEVVIESLELTINGFVRTNG